MGELRDDRRVKVDKAQANAIVEQAYQRATNNLTVSIIATSLIAEQIERVVRNLKLRAGVRLLLAAAVAKIHIPSVDIRHPYTDIEGTDSYSGRSFDERIISPFIAKYSLPCNPTTAFLTPAFRNLNCPLVKNVVIASRGDEPYSEVLELLDAVQRGDLNAPDLLAELIRNLIVMRNERQFAIDALLQEQKSLRGKLRLSAEGIVTLIQQHIASPNSSRLPVLVVAAAYTIMGGYVDEKVLPLKAHNAADKQTGALGDVEITLSNDQQIVTSYEMKHKRVTTNDIDAALQKLAASLHTVDNYIFITTDIIDREVSDYASTLYDRVGVEFVVLDCIGFLRHFLHLFHRLRIEFLDTYQQLVLDEPTSAVNQPLKTTFLALRNAAELALPEDQTTSQNDEIDMD